MVILISIPNICFMFCSPYISCQLVPQIPFSLFVFSLEWDFQNKWHFCFFISTISQCLLCLFSKLDILIFTGSVLVLQMHRIESLSDAMAANIIAIVTCLFHLLWQFNLSNFESDWVVICNLLNYYLLRDHADFLLRFLLKCDYFISICRTASVYL